MSMYYIYLVHFWQLCKNGIGITCKCHR